MLVEIGEHKCCCDCRYSIKDSNEEPCVNCKNNFVVGTPEHESHELYWCAKDEDETTSAVNHPNHYNQGNIECIDAMVAAFGKNAVENFCLVNAFKYVWRAEDKNGFEDIDKAIWYLNKYKELVDSE